MTTTNKAERKTINSTWFALDIEGLASVLRKQIGNGDDKDQLLKDLKNTVTEALKLIPQMWKEEANAQKEADKQREAERRQKEEERNKLASAETAAIKAAQDALLKTLVDSGLDIEVAQQRVSSLIKMPKEKAVYKRFIVKYEGQEFEIAEKGNMSQQAADAVKASNLSRGEFIEKHLVKEVEAA